MSVEKMFTVRIEKIHNSSSYPVRLACPLQANGFAAGEIELLP